MTTKRMANKLIAGASLLFFVLCGLSAYWRSGFGPVSTETVSGTWTISYVVVPGNLLALDLISSESEIVEKYLTCQETITLTSSGYLQTLEFSGADVPRITRSGRWDIQSSGARATVRLYRLVNLLPEIDLRAAQAHEAYWSHFGPMPYTFFEPPDDMYWSSPRDVDSDRYVFPNDGYVLLYPRQNLAGHRVLVRGILEPEGGLYEYEAESFP